MNDLYIGYDVGTKTVKIAYGSSVNDHKSIIIEHYSDPQGVISKFENQTNIKKQNYTGYITGRYRDSIKLLNNRIATIDWTKPVIRYCNDHYDKDIRYVVDIGAAGLSLLELKQGRFHRFVTNSICASGTGSFLDQQMIRMGLDFEAVANISITNRVPSIASRCAVFAKSDLIHRQQEGFTIEELWNGLVKGMAEACFITLLRGDNISGKLLFIGGLVKNRLFLHYFSKLLDENMIVIPEEPDTFLALSCLNYISQKDHSSFLIENNSACQKTNVDKPDAFEPPLYPDKSPKKHYFIDSFNNEITLCNGLKVIESVVNKEHVTGINIENNYSQNIPVVLGVDVGSTSTKAVLLHHDTGELLLGLYRKTHGNPIQAYQNILKGINRLMLENPFKFDIQGMGTTGSGRQIVGVFAGADKCINEITTHLKGGLKEVPNVKTIFEIGGQDSKYIFVEDGWMKDANMNYVCAAGTGSFLEEQAQNLNFKLDDFENLCRGVPAPKTNDRCTVFMEQDSKKLIVDGHSKPEVVASLLYSVCRNYLHRVVQNRPIVEPILFLGATARNKGLVEAFSNILNKQIITSPNSHLTGAIGVAEIIRNDIIEGSSTKEIRTKFKGFSIHSEKIEFKEKNCRDCHNNCRIIYFESESGTVSWGHQCGKEGVEKSTKKNIQNQHYKDYFRLISQINKTSTSHPAIDSLDLQQRRTNDRELNENINYPGNNNLPKNKTIYITKSLHFFSHNSLWQYFWQNLGFDVVTLPDTNRSIISTSLSYSPNEICYPLKLAIGHIIYALEKKLLPLFVPYLIKDTNNPATSNSYFCPMTQGLPAILRSIMQYNGLAEDNILSPVIDLSKEKEDNIDSLWESLQDVTSISKDKVAKSFTLALDSYQEEQQLIFETAKRTISELTEQESTQTLKSSDDLITPQQKPVLVIMGRAYNLYDNILNLGLIKDAKRYGYNVIPADLIPVKREDIDDTYKNMYWSYGQKAITIAHQLLKYPDFYPIFLTNFNCGPDSFILSSLEDIWKEKPSLILELDEHSGNAGYLTRIEAFLDRIDNNRISQTNQKREMRVLPKKQNETQTSSCLKSQDRISKKTLLIPPMNPLGTILTSKAFKSYGYNAIPLVKEDINTFQLGKSYLRGSECLPAASTLGSIIDYFNTHEKNTEDKANNTSQKPFNSHEPDKANSKSQISVFMPCASGPCRFGQYGFLHKTILKRNDIDIDILSVNSENDYAGFPPGLRMQLVKSIIITDIMNKLGNKLRPHHNNNQIEEILSKYLNLLGRAIEKKAKITSVLKSLRRSIDNLSIDFENKKPLVGVVGEIYVRSSPFSNDNLIKKIEEHEAEAWLTPFMEWLHYTNYLNTHYKKKPLTDKIKETIASSLVNHYESKYYSIFEGILTDRIEPDLSSIIKKAQPYISESVRGEAILTVGRSLCFIEQGVRMIVNVAPFGCMPGTISSVILKNISLKYSVPIISLYYDGYVGFDTQLEHYLNNL